LGRTLGTALTARREAGPAEASNLFWSAAGFMGLGVLAFLVPKAVAIPFGVAAIWLALSGFFHSWRLYRERRKAP
jgi:hypothetical protein